MMILADAVLSLGYSDLLRRDLPRLSTNNLSVPEDLESRRAIESMINNSWNILPPV
jgi:hypothetical protein